MEGTRTSGCMVGSRGKQRRLNLCAVINDETNSNLALHGWSRERSQGGGPARRSSLWHGNTPAARNLLVLSKAGAHPRGPLFTGFTSAGSVHGSALARTSSGVLMPGTPPTAIQQGCEPAPHSPAGHLSSSCIPRLGYCGAGAGCEPSRAAERQAAAAKGSQPLPPRVREPLSPGVLRSHCP